MTSVPEVAASHSDYVMTQGIQILTLSHHVNSFTGGAGEGCQRLTDGDAEPSGGQATGSESLDVLTPDP